MVAKRNVLLDDEPLGARCSFDWSTQTLLPYLNDSPDARLSLLLSHDGLRVGSGLSSDWFTQMLYPYLND